MSGTANGIGKNRNQDPAIGQKLSLKLPKRSAVSCDTPEIKPQKPKILDGRDPASYNASVEGFGQMGTYNGGGIGVALGISPRFRVARFSASLYYSYAKGSGAQGDAVFNRFGLELGASRNFLKNNPGMLMGVIALRFLGEDFNTSNYKTELLPESVAVHHLGFNFQAMAGLMTLGSLSILGGVTIAAHQEQGYNLGTEVLGMIALRWNIPGTAARVVAKQNPNGSSALALEGELGFLDPVAPEYIGSKEEGPAEAVSPQAPETSAATKKEILEELQVTIQPGATKPEIAKQADQKADEVSQAILEFGNIAAEIFVDERLAHSLERNIKFVSQALLSGDKNEVYAKLYASSIRELVIETLTDYGIQGFDKYSGDEFWTNLQKINPEDAIAISKKVIQSLDQILEEKNENINSKLEIAKVKKEFIISNLKPGSVLALKLKDDFLRVENQVQNIHDRYHMAKTHRSQNTIIEAFSVIHNIAKIVSKNPRRAENQRDAKRADDALNNLRNSFLDVKSNLAEVKNYVSEDAKYTYQNTLYKTYILKAEKLNNALQKRYGAAKK